MSKNKVNIFSKTDANATVNIGGQEFYGKTISISGNKIIVDGVAQEMEPVSPIYITVEGDVDTIETISGHVAAASARSIRTTSGNVVISGDVSNSVSTVSGDVTCVNIHGGVSTVSGDINT